MTNPFASAYRVFFLIVVLGIIVHVWSRSDDFQAPDLERTLHLLLRNNQNRIFSIRKSHNNLLVEKAKLQNTVSLNVTPSVTVGRGGVSTLVRGSFDIRDWSTSFDVNPLAENYHNTGAVLFPLSSSRRNKAAILDSIIKIEELKALYQVEKIILDELKTLWDFVIEIKGIENEIGIRKEIDIRIDSTGRFLSGYVKAGVVNRRSIDHFRITFTENRLQIAVLEKRLALIKDRLQNRFRIEEGLMPVVLEENRELLVFFETMPETSDGDNSAITLNEKIDSLNIESIRRRQSYDTHNEYVMSAGPVIITPGTLAGISIGAGAQLSLSFLRNRTSISDFNRKDYMFSGPIVGKVSVSDLGITGELDEYIQKIEEEIRKIVEELKSGIQYSVHSFNDLYSRLVHAKTNTSALRYAYIANRVSRIESLQEVKLRNILTKHISEL